MENQRNWLFPNTPVSTVLRQRPMALAIFERHGIDPWSAPNAEIADICLSHHLSWERFLQEMRGLPHPSADTDWKSAPLSQLLEQLSRQHWELVHEDLPSIKNELGRLPVSTDEGLRRIHELSLEWPAFSATLIEHIREEEGFLFPKMLHYDYCRRHRGGHVDFTGGSANVYVAIRLLDNEREHMSMVAKFLDEMRYAEGGDREPGSLGHRLHPLLDAFHAKLLRHSLLEADILYPTAKGIENALYEAAITGAKRP